MLADRLIWQQGFTPQQRPQVARLYWQAFGGKLHHVMGPDPRALGYLMAVMRADHCITACNSDGDVVAVAGFKTRDGGFVSGNSQDMRRAYGLWGGFWRLRLLMALASSVDNQRFLVDGIAVDANWRGQGLGSHLVAALCQEGRARGYRQIRLEVVDSNLRAQALYERLGFEVLGLERLGLLRWVFGFKYASVMIKSL